LQLEKSTAMSLESQVKIFKWISIFEGISFLVLLLIAMPLKYIWEAPEMVRIVGMAHGLLFVAYIFGALLLFKPLQWKTKTLLIVCLSSVLPLGPFYVEKKYL
jgi:integral membrane protein